MLEHADVKRILPHRHPMLQVDRVLDVDPGDRIVAVKAISGAEPCYADLAEGLPQSAHAYPPSLLLESLGQAGALLWLHTAALEGKSPAGTLIFGSARDCRITGSAYPGDVLRHVVHLLLVKGDNAFLRGETWVGDERIASVGSMLAVVRPGMSADPRSVPATVDRRGNGAGG
jgi:3-hydroxyacyl-[acyl-carrier-protein] dehydratase